MGLNPRVEGRYQLDLLFGFKGILEDGMDVHKQTRSVLDENK
jgi:hypothetical protein